MASTTSTLQRLIHARRLALDMTQAELAHAIRIQSPESISLVEAGKRDLALDRIPALADALQINREDLVKLALYEYHPMAYRALYGAACPGEPEEADDSKPRNKTSEMEDLFRTIPHEAKDSILTILSVMSGRIQAGHR
jgi:transcriptional regulator with XRE-family HTH domain